MRDRLLLPLAGVLTLAVGASVWAAIARSGATTTAAGSLLGPHSTAVATAEAARHVTGSHVRDITLAAAPATIDLGGRTVRTWAFNGTVPGPTINAATGDVIRATVINQLPDPLTVHWHGITIRNDMDGVPDLTQQPIAPGGRFVYQFTVSRAGTYFYHPHTGVQLDRGLYGALIVADPSSSNSQPDIPLLLDDWVDGTGRTPDQVLAALKDNAMSMPSSSSMPGMNMGGMGSGGSGMSGAGMGGVSTSAASPLGTDVSDVTYPLQVINGKDASHPAVYPVRAGQSVRLRLINAASATPYRVAFSGGAMAVLATDGYPVEPVRTDALLIGMGERYDVQVTIPGDGAFPLVAVAEGTRQLALAVLRAGSAALPMPDVHPAELDGRLLSYAQLHATAAASLPPATPDVTYKISLTGSMMGFDWGITAPSQRGGSLTVKTGQRVRLVITNATSMWHPIHLHGHTFQLVTGNGVGPRKDTVIVTPNSTVTIDVLADNPGQWVLHCHNTYHAEAGMMSTLNYVA